MQKEFYICTDEKFLIKKKKCSVLDLTLKNLQLKCNAIAYQKYAFFRNHNVYSNNKEMLQRFKNSFVQN